jgi:hypothetical protein
MGIPRILPLGGVHEKDVSAYFEPTSLDRGEQLLFGGSRVSGTLKAYHLAKA